ncbi:MAG: hypothetical protein AAF460_05595 [Pseudomonadota bacterium]
MARGHTWLRRALLAASLSAAALAAAQTRVDYDPASRVVTVVGVSAGLVQSVVSGDVAVRLQLDAKPDARGMLVRVAADDGGLTVSPRFPLKPGATYRLLIATVADAAAVDTAAAGAAAAEAVDVAFRVPAAEARPPALDGVSPSTAVWPANTLRVHLRFSEPMATGQVREAVWLESEDGVRVLSAFLTTPTELWDRRQQRLTLVFDPGRIKQGVGPNTRVGAPLETGRRYRLVVSGRMRSAAGVPLGTTVHHLLTVGEVERRAVAPDTWRVSSPVGGTRDPLEVRFDRAMDTLALQRFLRVRGGNGVPLDGTSVTDGTRWSFTPVDAWPDAAQLVAAPALEDVAGNRVRAAFDAAGTLSTARAVAVVLPVVVR